MTHTMKQFEVLSWASLFLEANDCEPKVAEILLEHHLQVSRAQFYMMMQEPILNTVLQPFKADIQKHVKTGVPVQHLTGYETFYGRKFCVNKDVLIPRPETEEIVEHIISTTKQHGREKPPTIVDVGTGSGVIAITLALEIQGATVYATDVSEKALTIAEKNARQIGASVTFLHGDFLQPIINNKIQADIIVSNPPYIAKSDKPYLQRTVKNFDPKLALFADEDGLAAYKAILNQASKIAIPGSSIVFEIGYEQGKSVYSLIKNTFPLSKVEIIQDINGNDRMVSFKI